MTHSEPPLESVTLHDVINAQKRIHIEREQCLTPEKKEEVGVSSVDIIIVTFVIGLLVANTVVMLWVLYLLFSSFSSSPAPGKAESLLFDVMLWGLVPIGSGLLMKALFALYRELKVREWDERRAQTSMDRELRCRHALLPLQAERDELLKAHPELVTPLIEWLKEGLSEHDRRQLDERDESEPMHREDAFFLREIDHLSALLEG